MNRKQLVFYMLALIGCMVLLYGSYFWVLYAQNHVGEGHHFPNCVTLYPGPYSQTVLVDGSSERWNMTYKTVGELPALRHDSCVNFEGSSYYVWFVHPEYLELGTTK